METLSTFKQTNHENYFQKSGYVSRESASPSFVQGVGFRIQPKDAPEAVDAGSDHRMEHSVPTERAEESVLDTEKRDRVIDPHFAGIVSEWTREDSVLAVEKGLDSFETYAIPIASTDYVGLEAIDKRLADRIWRLNNLYMVTNEDGDLVKFKLRPAQEHLLRGLHHKNIILKARQLGFTTFICLFMLDYALFNRNLNIGIIAQDQGAAATIFRKVKVAWENFPEPIKAYLALETKGDSKVEYEFSNGSVMRIATSLRSGTYQAVLVTEFGKICAHFPEKADEIIRGTFPAVPAKGLIFVESTAEGEGGNFWEMCMDAMEAKRLEHPLTSKEFKFFFFPWYQNPANVIPGDIDIPPNITEYLEKTQTLVKVEFSKEQKNWYYLESKIQKGAMKQEHPSTPDEAFLSTGNKLFNSEALEAQRIQYVRDPIEIDGDFRIYRRFVKGHVYGLGSDVSLGVKRDSSTIVVIDFTVGEVVLTYKSNTVDPITLAHDVKKAALMYGGCIAAVEANNTGIGTNITLHAIYPNIYTQTREDLLETSVTAKLGWLSSSASKPRMMYEMADAVDTGELKIPDLGIVLEAKGFNKEDSLTSNNDTATTRHFDLLIATGIAWQMRIYAKRGMAEPEEVARVEAHRAERLNRKTSKYR